MVTLGAAGLIELVLAAKDCVSGRRELFSMAPAYLGRWALGYVSTFCKPQGGLWMYSRWAG